MSDLMLERPARHRLSSTVAWLVRGVALAAAAFIAWDATSMSAAALTSIRADGLDSAVYFAKYLLPGGAVVAALCLPTVVALPALAGDSRSGTQTWARTLVLALGAYVVLLAAGYGRDGQLGEDLPSGLVALGVTGVLVSPLSAALLEPRRRLAAWAVSTGTVATAWVLFALAAGTHA